MWRWAGARRAPAAAASPFRIRAPIPVSFGKSPRNFVKRTLQTLASWAVVGLFCLFEGSFTRFGYLWGRAGPATRTIQRRLFFMPPHQDAGASPQAAQPVGAGGGSQVIAGPRAGGARFTASSVCVRGRAAGQFCTGWSVRRRCRAGRGVPVHETARGAPERGPACYRGSPVLMGGVRRINWPCARMVVGAAHLQPCPAPSMLEEGGAGGVRCVSGRSPGAGRVGPKDAHYGSRAAGPVRPRARGWWSAPQPVTCFR